MIQNIGKCLKDEFARRRKKNLKYSLRAFSRDIRLSPSFLSDVMNGKKKVSVDRALKISRSLGLSWGDSQIILQTAQFESAKSRGTKVFLKKQIQTAELLYGRFTNLKLRHFSPISNWYCMAILELTEISGFSAEPKWISKRLEISVNEAEQALLLMKQKGFIFQNERGEWQKSINATVQDAPSDEIRKFHRQQLVNAAKAIESQEFHRRHFSGVTMAIDTDQLPKAIELIKEFRSRMNALLESGTKKSVYHLGVQLFQLDTESIKCKE